MKRNPIFNERKEKCLLIMAQNGFLYQGSKSEGYIVKHPYKPCNLFQRILREFVFRFLPYGEKFFFNKEVFRGKWDYIMVWDPLITKKFLNYLHEVYPAAQIHFVYWNMVGKARHLLPSMIPDFVCRWTYDAYDSEKYCLNLYTTYPYYSCFIKPRAELLYDVLFVGRDKGRANFLISLEKRLKELGLRTKFVITRSSRLSPKKSFYQPEMKYDELCELISHSRSVLNVVMENQRGLTLRDLEYVFQKVKLITTNQSIIDDPIYCANNVYIIRNNNIDDIKEFLDRPYERLPTDVIAHHTFDSFINEITNG